MAREGRLEVTSTEECCNAAIRTQDILKGAAQNDADTMMAWK